MTRKPVVAIVGRPNVGKSTLFNKIVGKRRAIIEDIPGITRDRLYDEAKWDDKRFIVIDTGGIHTDPYEDIDREVREQALLAVEEADIIIMMMDAESGLMPSDLELIDLLRKYTKKTFYAVNKIDGPNKEKNLLYDFYTAGIEVSPLSALNGYGYEDLFEKIAELLPETDDKVSKHPRISIVGRPNVGKSTLTNSLLGKNRMIVSDIPGTTRDAVDSVCSYYNTKYTLVDTAGIRRKGKMSKTFEKYSFIRTVRNVEDCDVVLMLIDASEGVVELDQKIAGLIYKSGKGAVILLNKWDLVDKERTSAKKMEQEISQKLWFMRHVPVLTISALSRQRVTKVFAMVKDVIAEDSKRISTNQLNTFLKKVVSIKEPPLYRGRRVKIYYITQVKTNPPSFTIFTNQKDGVKPQYVRFLERHLRQSYGFKGVPLRIFVRQREGRGKK